MFCSNCGNQVQDGARFCENCGALVVSPAPVSQPAPFAPYPLNPEPAPVAEPAPAAEPEAPAAPAKKKKKLLPLILILAVVIVAVVAVVLLFGKQTVYLVTETVSENMNGPTTTQRYEYDGEGRITKYEYEMEYPEHLDYSYDMKYEISYEYSKDGKLESAQFETDGETIEVEYIYEKGVLTGFECDDLMDDSGAAELEIECDDDGRFEYIGFLDEEGNEYFTWRFKYYDDGTLKKSTHYSIYPINREVISEYNENGQTIEQTTFWNGELQYRVVYDYDDAGRQVLQEQYDSNDELQMRYEIEYTSKKDRLTAMAMLIETQDYDGEKIEAEIVFECEWDDLECTLTIDEIDGDEDALSTIGLSDEDIEIIFEKDKHGNLVKTEISVDGEMLTNNSTEYEEFKVSRDYSEPNVRIDPLYLYFLMNL